MKYKQPRVVTILSLLVITVLLLPHAARSEDEVSMDDALLLMIAGQSRMYDGEYLETAFSVPGLGAVHLDFSSQGASQEQINEQRQLGKVYSRWANQLSASDSSRQFFRDKANQHFDQADELAKARRRYLRRHNNIFRRLGRAVGQPVGKLLQGILQGGRFVFRGLGKVGQVVVTIAKDEVIIRAKQIIRTKIQDLIDLSQGKLDSVVARIAKKAGWPAAELFREIVLAPGFRRLERAIDQNLDQFLGQRSQAATSTPEEDPSEPDEPEHTTDWDNVNEEGDTDYEDEGVLEPTTSPTPDQDTTGEESKNTDEDENKLELTPEELANQGRYYYECNRFGDEITWTFYSNSVNQYFHWTHPLERSFRKIEPNVYEHDGFIITFTQSGYEANNGNICIRQ